jgi:peptidoglycan DL-endopeptidase CwlO
VTSRPFRLKVALATVVILTLSFASPAGAEPTPDPTAPPSEGGTPTLATLRANLATAAAGYIEAEAQLETSKKKQAEAQERLTLAELDMAQVRAGVAKYAAEAYRTGRLGTIGLMLQANTQDGFLDRAVTLDKMTRYDQARLHAFLEAKQRAQQAKAEIDAQIAIQAAAAAEMQKRQTAAERALASAGGTRVRVDIDPATLPTANPAPRNPDGSWPAQSATVDDPTTGGMITPRLMHAYNETKRLGWNWYVSCWRPGTMYEHPKGRACDWATNPSGFAGTASGSNKLYGDRLASFYVKNAKALGVMYVVWYCTIWLYGSGWRRYNSAGSKCGDSPANDHTNHVHLSVY